MQTTAALKQDMEFNKDFSNIIDVLKASAVMQFRSLQLKQKPNEEFLSKLELCFNILSRKKINHPYLVNRPDLPSLIVIVTSDSGFLGELNTVLVNSAVDERKSNQDEIIVIGEQGARYLQD
ncbi:MAG: F0F1 ATP synthase subunit gamma, partial [Candidatus Omnitrophica bacterium]|nr:F0F1 ATP synthase subunit gamma [Candidatus Omnitrophota bacterium]